MRTKVVQGFNQEESLFLNKSLIDIFNILKCKLNKLNLNSFTILNIIFRQINNHLMVTLHIKEEYNEKIIEEINNIKNILQQNINALFISFGKTYNRNNKRVTIFGNYYNEYIFTNNSLIRYSSDSFLQQNLNTAKELYTYISNNLKTINMNNKKIFRLIGIGDDCLNISSYLNEYIYSFMHCEETMNCMYNLLDKKYEKHPATLNLQTWYKNINLENTEDNELVLITTPGRKGLSNQEIEVIKKLKIKYIIYIGCCIKSSNKNMKELEDKYKIIEKKEFPEMFSNIEGYLETCYILENPIEIKFISIGCDCSIAYHLKQEFYPFDWFKSSSIDIIQYLLINNFEPLFDITKYRILKKSDVHFHIPEIDYINLKFELNPTLIIRFEISKTDYIDFPHDFKIPENLSATNNNLDEIKDQFEEFVNKMKRRIERLNKIKIENRNFIRYETKKINQKLYEKYIQILEYCNEILIYTNRNIDLKFINLNSKIKIIQDEYQDKHKSWKREGLKHYF